MIAPFVTAGETVHHIDVLLVMLEHDGYEGRAETMGMADARQTADRRLESRERSYKLYSM